MGGAERKVDGIYPLLLKLRHYEKEINILSDLDKTNNVDIMDTVRTLKYFSFPVMSSVL